MKFKRHDFRDNTFMLTDGEYGEKLTTYLNFEEMIEVPDYPQPEVLYSF